MPWRPVVLPPAPPASSPAVREVLRRIGRRDTAPELALRRQLHALGLRFLVDATPAGTSRRRRADVVLRGSRIAVLVHGCFWHRCELHLSAPKANAEWGRLKLAAIVARDADQLIKLAAAAGCPSSCGSTRTWRRRPVASRSATARDAAVLPDEPLGASGSLETKEVPRQPSPDRVPQPGPGRVTCSEVDESDELARLRSRVAELEQQVCEQDAWSRLLYQDSPVGQGIAGADGTVEGVNGALVRLLGYEPEELAGQPVGVVLAPDVDEPHATALVMQLAAGEINPYTCRRTYAHRDGSRVPVVMTVVVERDGEGALLRAAVHLLDDSERTRAEAELRQAEADLDRNRARLLAVLDAASDAYVGSDAQGRIQEWNRAAEALYGYTAREAIGHTTSDLLLDDTARAAYLKRRSDFVQAGGGGLGDGRVEFEVVHKDGRRIAIESTFWRTGEGGGGRRRTRRGAACVAGQVGVPRQHLARDPDAAERGARDDRAAARHAALAAAARVGRARPPQRRGPAGGPPRHPRPVQDRGRSSRDRAHRLRRPPPGGGCARAAAGRGRGEVARAAPRRRARRPADGRRRPGPPAPGAAEPARQRGQVHRARRGAAAGRLRRRRPAALHRHGHRHRHGRRGPGAALRAVRAGRRVDHPSLRRHRTGAHDLPGPRRPARRRAVADQRSRRRQHLLVLAPAARGRDGPPTQRTHLEGGPALHGLRLLLAEDNAVNRQVAVGLLTREGCAVDVAEDGQQALDALAARPGAYDALLLDCQMPLLDGYDTARAVRRREREAGTPRLPIVALTASAMASDRERCLDAGMDDYLSKPFSSAALSAALSRLLAGSRTTVAPVLDPAPLAELREALGEGAGSFVVELVRVVAGQVAEHLPRLRGDDVEARRTSAHALRGSSLTLGACRVAQLCADAEEDPAAVSGPLCDALAREVEAARAALSAGAVAV